MSYCLNPNCSEPKNQANAELCHSCDSQLLLRDRYRVLKALGQGGFGATFLAEDRGLPGRPHCVIKQLRPSGTAPHMLQMARELFEREALTLGKIGNHPQMPRLLDYFEDKEQFYLVQEYISGATLQQEIKRNGVLSEAGARQFLSEMLPLLQYLHERQVIHRDIKPANLIRRAQDSKLVLIDFGAVKNQVTQTAASQYGQTALTAYAIGTPGFAPPEQMAMRPVYASDIYALGITCVYLLTGKSPKDLEYNPTTGDTIWEHMVNLSQHFMEVLRKMLEVSVRNRYRCASEVLRALEMEPYLDSLANGLVTQPSNGRKGKYSNLDSNSNHSTTTDNNNSSVAQVAAAIRARRARVLEVPSSKMTDVRQRVLTTKSTTTKSTTITTSDGKSISGNKSKLQRYLNAEGLLAAYLKGRRDFASYNLSLLNLAGANLSGTNFHSSRLEKTNFQGANLYNNDFGKANMNRANLRDSNLSKAYLFYTDLEGADLRGADLSNAYLCHANLRGANLCGANLTGAKVTEEQLASAKTNWMTVRPSGRRGLL